MRRKKHPLPFLEKVEILSAGAEGKAIARHENLVIFVPLAAPGDIVDLQVTKKKRSYLEGRIVKFHTLSPLRTEPLCKHFGLCGGCSWQHVKYTHQLEFKVQQIEDAFRRIGKFLYPPLLPILPSSSETHYRNKLEFTFSNRRWLTTPGQEMDDAREMYGLGFHLPGMFDRILDIETCYLQPEPSNSIRLAVKQFVLDQNFEFFNNRNHTGFLRNLLVRNSVSGEVMVMLVTASDDQIKIRAILEFLQDKFPEISSLVSIINPKQNDSISDLTPVIFHGKQFLTEEMEGLKFMVGPLSFFQTNSKQAYFLNKTVREFANLQGHETVYDLYTGTGTIANFIAMQAKKVVGIEYVEAAIKDAKANSELNGLTNTYFIAGDIAKVLNQEFSATYGIPDVIITDPPRAGMHEIVVKRILELAPEKIVYVSCNPSTQARDIALLDQAYQVTRVQPIDMFPHTYHVENIALLEKRQQLNPNTEI